MRFIWSAVEDPEVLVLKGVSVRVATPERAIADCARRYVSPEVLAAVVARMVVPTTPAPEGVAT